MATASGIADVPCTLRLRYPSWLSTHRTTARSDGRRQVDIIFSPMAEVIANWRSWDKCGGSNVTVSGIRNH